MKVYTLLKIFAYSGGTWCDNTIEVVEKYLNCDL